jgi:hypothetical protein
MSAGRDLFLQIGRFVHGDVGAHNKLCEAAKLWRADAQHFSAGIAMSAAVDAAWGQPERMLEAHNAARNDFEHVVSEEAADTPVTLSAFHKLVQTVHRSSWLFDIDRALSRSRVRELRSEFARRLLKYFGQSHHADNYLVRGIKIVTDLDGKWQTQFPSYEVENEVEQFEEFGARLILNIPSAFRLYISDADWEAAHWIIKMRAHAFTTPSLKGWRAVTLANLNPSNAIARFDEAADAFAADQEPGLEELVERGVGQAAIETFGQNTFGPVRGW